MRLEDRDSLRMLSGDPHPIAVGVAQGKPPALVMVPFLHGKRDLMYRNGRGVGQ